MEDFARNIRILTWRNWDLGRILCQKISWEKPLFTGKISHKHMMYLNLATNADVSPIHSNFTGLAWFPNSQIRADFQTYPHQSRVLAEETHSSYTVVS
jgi:hypothetical protein